MSIRDSFIDWVIKPIVRLFFRLFYRMEVHGKEHIPAEGGFVLAANHVSFFDPPALGVACRRLVTFTPRSTLNESLIYRLLTATVPVIPIERGAADLATTRKIVQHLKDGNILGIFPEETRSADGELGPFKRGVHLLSSRAKVPVLPSYIAGSYEIWPRQRKWPRLRGKIVIRFGPVVNIREHDPATGLEMLRTAISQLRSGLANNEQARDNQ